MSFIEIYTVAVVHLLGWPSLRYWMVYRKVKWKDGDTGKALFNMARALAVLVLLALVGFWWPFPGYTWLYAAACTYLTGAVWFQYRVMRRLVQHRTKREKVLAHYIIHPEGIDHAEATEAVRPDDARREDRRLADEGCTPEG